MPVLCVKAEASPRARSGPSMTFVPASHLCEVCHALPHVIHIIIPLYLSNIFSRRGEKFHTTYHIHLTTLKPSTYPFSFTLLVRVGLSHSPPFHCSAVKVRWCAVYVLTARLAFRDFILVSSCCRSSHQTLDDKRSVSGHWRLRRRGKH